jgi:hypothetical protein
MKHALVATSLKAVDWKGFQAGTCRTFFCWIFYFRSDIVKIEMSEKYTKENQHELFIQCD